MIDVKDISVAFTLFGWQVRWYGILIATGAILALVIAYRLAPRRRIHPDAIMDCALWTIPLGIIGARLYYVVFSWDKFSGNLFNIIKIWEGGLAIYGAVLGGLLGIFIFAKRNGLAFGALADIAAPGVILAQAIGRWGNFFNREAMGNVVRDTKMWFFPYAVKKSQYEWRQATFFYESMWDLLVFIVLIWYFNGKTFRWPRLDKDGDWANKLDRHRFPQEGNIALLYMVLYGFGRMFIETLREDSLKIGSLRVSVLVSIILALIGIVMLYLRRQKKVLCACQPGCDCGCWDGVDCDCVGHTKECTCQDDCSCGCIQD